MWEGWIFLNCPTRFPRAIGKIFICYQIDGSSAIQLFLLCSSNAVQIKLLESSTYAVLINQTEAIAASQDTKVLVLTTRIKEWLSVDVSPTRQTCSARVNLF